MESTVTIPENIHSMGMGIRTQSYQGYMLFDDMSMVLKESGPDISPVPEAPDNLRMKHIRMKWRFLEQGSRRNH